jgi:hypothetical protein
MFTTAQIINLGLAKIASSRVVRIDPPKSSLEIHMATGYAHWKRTELTKRRWVFATEDDMPLTRVPFSVATTRPFKYAIPTECLRPVRMKYSEWKQSGRFIYSAEPNLSITMIMNKDENEFDPLFVEVLACRIALESVEYVTQSNTKKADVMELYQIAVRDAAQANAYVRGSDDVTSNDDVYPYLTARH